MIHGVLTKPLKVIPDERGWLMEMLRDDDPFFQRFGQVYLTVVYPEVVKGMSKVVLYDSREDSPTKGQVNEFFLGEKNPTLLVIPPLVLHGMKGIGVEPAYLVNVPTYHYDYKDPDEHRVPAHDPSIPYDWSRKDG